MDLILWRHADARDQDGDNEDLQRPLSPKGERQARRMARWLEQHLPDSTRILVSPTRRAVQTAQALSERFRIVDDLEPGGTVGALLHAARWPDSREPVLVVGHQRTLGLTAAYLVAGTAEPWPIRKGSVWWLRGRRPQEAAEEPPRAVQLQAVLSADQV